jgi:DNA-binding transcriptional MerR regulator
LENLLPPIPAKRYFTIGEVSELCGVKPHVLRYWEQEFTQLRPMKRRGNRRYYQHHEVLMIRKIRDLLYDQGFTISGARNKLHELVQVESEKRRNGEVMLEGIDISLDAEPEQPEYAESSSFGDSEFPAETTDAQWSEAAAVQRLQFIRQELVEIRELLTTTY